ncbi:MAG: hypothetical protein I8H66_01115 [Sphingobacteriia bacterium]|nr:hypothetical protein [Sphingobacteriia bacterium]
MKKSIWLELCCALLILLFAYVSISKFINYPVFFDAMKTQPFPDWMGWFIASTLPAAELLIAGLLFFDRTRRPALKVALSLMVAFTIYAALFAFNIIAKKPCICGGIMEKLTWENHFYINLFFTAISMIGLWLEKHKTNHKAEISIA